MLKQSGNEGELLMYKFCMLWPSTFCKREEKRKDICMSSLLSFCFFPSDFGPNHLDFLHLPWSHAELSMLPTHVLRPGWSLACKILTPNVHLASLWILFSNCLTNKFPATPYRLSWIILLLRLYPHLTWYRHNFYHVFNPLLYKHSLK